MDAESRNPGYMQLSRGNDWRKRFSSGEMWQVAGRRMVWIRRLTDEAEFIAGNGLRRGGKIVFGKDGQFVLDGLLAEFKEASGRRLFCP